MKSLEQINRVNWVDGMKINKSHFIQSEDALLFNSFLLANGHVNKNRYGLITQGEKKDSHLKLWISQDNQTSTTVQILLCRAITSGGIPIFISSNQLEETPLATDNTLLTTTIDGEDGDWPKYLVIQTHPFDRVVSGEATTTEMPPRKPDVSARYSLHTVSEKEMKSGNLGPFHLPIAKFLLNIDGMVVMDNNYVPPCIAINSHLTLIQKLRDLENGLGSVEHSCLKILQKVHARKQQNSLSEIMVQIIEGLMSQIPPAMQAFKHELAYDSPLRAISILGGLARTFKNYADVRIGSGKEELFNYLNEWCGLNPNVLEQNLDTLINQKYQHHDPMQAFTRAQNFLNTIVPMFKKLSELEYIGKRDSGKLFIKEYQLEKQKGEDTDSSISFLAE